MTRLTDAIEVLEHELDKNPGETSGALFARRYALRKAMDAWGREQYDEGYHDGRRDATETRYEADQRARERAAGNDEEKQDGCPGGC